MSYSHYPSLFALEIVVWKPRPGKIYQVDAHVKYLAEYIASRTRATKNPQLEVARSWEWFVQRVKTECGVAPRGNFKVEGSGDVQLPLPF